IYHAALRPFLEDPALELSEFEKTGVIRWSTDLAQIPKKHGVNNVYADLGTAFANSAVANPRFAAAFVGQLVNEMGADHVMWGSDSVWYGSPQWQIEALRRLEIPDDMMKKMGWKTQLGAADGAVKNKIFGQNSAKMYKYKIAAEYETLTRDKLALMKSEYEREGTERNNAYYGYVPKRA
ncbi:MAG: amidohydrolase family protein, partial [Betaproteobacteria bacterium]